jgi:hypothetical protein
MNDDLSRENKLLVLLLSRSSHDLVAAGERDENPDFSGSKLKEQNRSLRHQVTVARREAEALRSSLSWRITAPLRAIASFVSGFGGKR